MIESKAPKPFCFVLMPFKTEFDSLYKNCIRVACEEAGAYCERVDEQDYDGTILDRIYNQISKADFLIAVMTGQNPNVFYEVGYAHALGKSVILITECADDIPFDLRSYLHITYGKDSYGLKNKLVEKVVFQITNSREESQTSRIGLEALLDGVPLQESGTVITLRPGYSSIYLLTVSNVSTQVYDPADLAIGVELPSFLGLAVSESYLVGSSEPLSAPLSKDRVLFTWHLPTVLFPDASASSMLRLSARGPRTIPFDEDVPIRIRFFTSIGCRDFYCVARTVIEE